MIKIPDSIIDNSYKQALEFVKNISIHHSASAYSLQISSIQTCKIVEGPCHAGMKEVPDIICLAGGYIFNKTTAPVALRVWEWITNPQKSPWRKLTTNSGIELIRNDNGNGLGFILNNAKVLKSVPWNFHKNFCILCRTVSEHSGRWQLWYDLVEKHGVDECDAWYLASCFVSKGDSSLYPSDVRQGGHWALTDNGVVYDYSPKHSNYGGTPAYLDWDILRTGEVHLKQENIHPFVNGFFCIDKKKRGPKDIQFNNYKIFDSNVLKSTVQTRFSKAVFGSIEDTLKVFYSWQKEQGILKNDTVAG